MSYSVSVYAGQADRLTRPTAPRNLPKQMMAAFDKAASKDKHSLKEDPPASKCMSPSKVKNAGGAVTPVKSPPTKRSKSIVSDAGDAPSSTASSTRSLNLSGAPAGGGSSVTHTLLACSSMLKLYTLSCAITLNLSVGARLCV